MPLVLANDVLNTVLTGVVIITVCSALSMFAFWIVLRFFSSRRQPQYTPFIHAVYGVVGTLYAVLAAFMVVVIWGYYVAANDSVNGEVANLNSMLRQTAAYPPATRTALRNQILLYARDSALLEWPGLGSAISNKPTRQDYAGLWAVYMTFNPRSENEQEWYSKSLSNLTVFAQQRRLRLAAAQSRLPWALWVLLIAGGAMTMWFTLFLWTPYTRRQAVAIGSFAALIGFVFFLINSLQLPFTGAVKVAPTPLLQLYQQNKAFVTPGYQRLTYASTPGVRSELHAGKGNLAAFVSREVQR